MFKSVILLALVALAVATPAPKPEEKKDLKTDESLGLGYYGGVYGAYPSWGYGSWDSGAWGARGWGARSLWGAYPYSATYDPYYYPYTNGLWY